MIIGIIFIDDVVEREIESIATLANGAKVEVDNLEISLTELFIRWDRLQVANPRKAMKNRIETGKCELDFEFIPLLSDKFIVESFTVTDIQTNTDREEDGRLSKEELATQPGFIKNTAQYLEKEVSSLVAPQLNSLKKQANVDSVLNVLNIQSIDKMQALSSEVNTKYAAWDNKLNNLTLEEDLKEVETQIRSIDVKKLKTADQILEATGKVDKIYSTLKSSKKEFDQISSNLSADIQNIQTQVGMVDKWIEDDYSRALSLAKIPQINAQNIGKLLFGKRVVDTFNNYLSYIDLARKYTSSKDDDQPEKQSPPRLKGQDIYFYNENARPDFWIKKMNISGLTENNISWKGLIKDIVSDQRLIGNATEIDVGGENTQGIKLALNGILNYLSEEPSESFKLNYSGFSLADVKISDSPLLPNKLSKGRGTLQTGLELIGNKIDGNINFSANKVSFQFTDKSKKQNKLENMLQSILKTVNTVDFQAKIEGKSDNLKFSIRSNLDDVLTEKIGAIVSEEFNKVKTEIRTRVDKEVNKYREELNQLVSSKESGLNKEIVKYEEMLDTEMSRADSKKKEIENVYEKEKKNIENKVKDLLKF
jgi:uncharacterized protein (TIGR03545 family)